MSLVVMERQGTGFGVDCMECGWSLLGAPTHQAALTVGQAHLTTHDETDRHQGHLVQVGRRGER